MGIKATSAVASGLRQGRGQARSQDQSIHPAVNGPQDGISKSLMQGHHDIDGNEPAIPFAVGDLNGGGLRVSTRRPRLLLTMAAKAALDMVPIPPLLATALANVDNEMPIPMPPWTKITSLRASLILMVGKLFILRSLIWI